MPKFVINCVSGRLKGAMNIRIVSCPILGVVVLNQESCVKME